MSTLNEQWTPFECDPPEPCQSFIEKQFPNGTVDENGKVIGPRPHDDPGRTEPIVAECCGRGVKKTTKCKTTRVTIIEAYLTVYNTVLTDPLQGLKPNEDYCPNEDNTDSLCPPKNSRSGQMELVITAKKQDPFVHEPENPDYRDIPRVGCGGKILKPNKPKEDFGIPDTESPIDNDTSVPGFPVIIPIEWTQRAPVIIPPKDIKDRDFDNPIPIDNCPIGPYKVSSQQFVTERTCEPKNNAAGYIIAKCAEIGMEIVDGAVICHKNDEALCNLENCLEPDPEKLEPVENENGDKGFKFDVNAYIRKKGQDKGWDCIGYNDAPSVIVSRSTGLDATGEIAADIIRLDIVIGSNCEDQLPPGNDLKKATLFKKEPIDCNNYSGSCTTVAYWEDKNTPPATPEGYVVYKTYTCADIGILNSKAAMPMDIAAIEKECSEYLLTPGYCCVTDTVKETKDLIATTFKDCCQTDSLPGISASWLGSAKDISENEARIDCDPCVACCLSNDNNNALCVYSFQDTTTGKWTYAKEIVSGKTPEIRSRACSNFVGSSGSQIFVDQIAQGQEVNIQDENLLSYKIYLENITTGAKTSQILKPPFKNKYGEIISASDYIAALTPIYFSDRQQVVYKTEVIDNDAHILFNSINGGLKLNKGINVDPLTDYSCTTFCPNTTSSQGYRSAAQQCTDLNGKVAVVENKSNTDKFWSNDPCEDLGINCADLPEPPSPKPNPSTDPELPQPLPKEDVPKNPPQPEDPKKPPEKQPRRCTDVTFTYKGNNHKVAISFPLKLADTTFGEFNFKNIEELLSYIENKVNNSGTIPDVILETIGIDKNDTIDGILNDGINWTNGSEYDCGDTPAPDAPTTPPNPSDPVDPDNPPNPVECACLSIDNAPNQNVNLPITFTQDGDSYNLDSPQKLNEYLQKYSSPPFSENGQINNTFLPSEVQMALGLDGANNADKRFTYKMVPCECNGQIPDNPQAPNPANNDPVPPPKGKPQQPAENIECNNKKSELKKLNQYLNELKIYLEIERAKSEQITKQYKQYLARYKTECVQAWFPATMNCVSIKRNIDATWDGSGPAPYPGAKPNLTEQTRTNNIKEKTEQYQQKLEQQQILNDFVNNNCS